MALTGPSPDTELTLMNDPDSLAVCRDCLHDLILHWIDGCWATDNLGNRCACEQAP